MRRSWSDGGGMGVGVGGGGGGQEGAERWRGVTDEERFMTRLRRLHDGVPLLATPLTSAYSIAQ